MYKKDLKNEKKRRKKNNKSSRDEQKKRRGISMSRLIPYAQNRSEYHNVTVQVCEHTCVMDLFIAEL